MAERITDYRAHNVADWVMYRQALADAATARGWAVHWYDPKTVNVAAAAALGLPSLDGHLKATAAIAGRSPPMPVPVSSLNSIICESSAPLQAAAVLHPVLIAMTTTLTQPLPAFLCTDRTPATAPSMTKKSKWQQRKPSLAFSLPPHVDSDEDTRDDTWTDSQLAELFVSATAALRAQACVASP